MTLPAPHRFTVEEFDRMGEVGIFNEDDRVELMEGEIEGEFVRLLEGKP